MSNIEGPPGKKIVIPDEEQIGCHCSRCGWPMDMTEREFRETESIRCIPCGGIFARREVVQ